MDKFIEMQAFVAVADAGSFVKAAEALDVSKAAISRYVADLELRLGIRLLHRTTRKLSLTAEGEVFLARCRELLGGVDEAEAEITTSSGDAIGVLRINVPFSFGLLHLAPLWAEFMAQHPKVVLDVTLADPNRRSRRGGVRHGGAHRPPAQFIADQPTAHIDTHGVVRVANLPGHARTPDPPVRPGLDTMCWRTACWRWATSGISPVRMERPRSRSSRACAPTAGDTCRVAALRHQGIVLQPSFLVGPDLLAGTLVEVMPSWRSIELGVYAVYPITQVRLAQGPSDDRVPGQCFQDARLAGVIGVDASAVRTTHRQNHGLPPPMTRHAARQAGAGIGGGGFSDPVRCARPASPRAPAASCSQTHARGWRLSHPSSPSAGPPNGPVRSRKLSSFSVTVLGEP